MTEIKSNIVTPKLSVQNQNILAEKQNNYATNLSGLEMLSLNDEFVKQHKKNGLFEKLYNKIKNVTNLGVGSKKTLSAIKGAKEGKITEEDARNVIDKYRKSQVNSAQAFGDLMSIVASGATFFLIKNKLKLYTNGIALNEKNINEYVEKSLEFKSSKRQQKFMKKILEFSKSKTKFLAFTALTSAFAGGITKYWTLKFNRAGSEEFKTDKKKFNGAKDPYDKAAYKIEKKMNKSERRKTNFRNFFSGAINGLMMPISLVGGAFAGVPLYIAGNSLNRYFIGNREEKDKSINGYIENLKNDSITHATLAVATALPMLKLARFTNVFDANMKKVFDNLKNVELKESGFEGKTAYQEISDALLESPKIKKIIYNDSHKEISDKVYQYTKEGMTFDQAYKKAQQEFNLSVNGQITKLTEENIFAVKIKQVAKDYSELTQALKENCPETYTIDEVKKIIQNTFGDNYEIKKLLGVGTVAETYLAKGKDGKDVCIKILKKGINEAKIETDKQKFIKLIEEMPDKSKDEKDILIKNIENLADGLKHEVNFAHEKEAAEKLAKFTKIANVVKPIEVKDNIYVMEKAEGISLQGLAKLNALQYQKAYASGEELVRINAEIEKIKSRTPNFDDIVTLSSSDSQKILNEYQNVLVEQYVKIDKNGKTIHADIHPGNIFIDVKALKSGKGKLFTLIDTGNTLDLSKEQALRNLKLTQYTSRGSAKDIAEYVIDGAKLPEIMTKEKALEKITEELKKCFFDTETKLGIINNDNILDLTSNIMKKYKIIPNDTQASLKKTKESSNTSLNELYEILISKKIGNVNKDSSNIEKANAIGKVLFSLGSNEIKYLLKKSLQERRNTALLSPAEKVKFKKDQDLLAKNSEDYLTFKLKQFMQSFKSKENF